MGRVFKTFLLRRAHGHRNEERQELCDAMFRPRKLRWMDLPLAPADEAVATARLHARPAATQPRQRAEPPDGLVPTYE